MITNFSELTSVIDRTAIEQDKIKSIMRKCIYDHDFNKVKELHKYQQALDDRLLAYVSNYKKNVQKSYLEKKLYGDKVASIENELTSKSLMSDVLFCVFELDKEYQSYRENEINYVLKGKLEESEDVKSKKESLLRRIEVILIEGKAICGSLDDSKKNLQIAYLKLLKYYGFNYSVKKESLELLLKDKERVLRTRRALLNLKLINSINKEIEEIKIELESINLKLLLIA
jgi:hypothetical protein